MRSKWEHHEKSTLDRKRKRLKNVDSIKGAFIFVLRSQKSIFPDCPIFYVIKAISEMNYSTRKVQVAGANSMVPAGCATGFNSGIALFSPSTNGSPLRVITVARMLPSLPAKV